jgi:predicted ABC-class ATPase
LADREALSRILARIDGRGYKAYGDIRGAFEFDRFTLYVDRVQGDPFAAPSKLRLRIPRDESGLPAELSRQGVRERALADFLARSFRDAIENSGRRRSAARSGRRSTESGTGGRGERGRSGRRTPARENSRGSGKSGLIFIDAGHQEVLERSAIRIEEAWVEARIEVGLPAAGRRVLGREADSLLTDALPRIVEEALLWDEERVEAARGLVECVENQEFIRDRLPALGLVAFVADGSILPRTSGASEKPMQADEAVPFRSPTSLAVEIEVPNPLDASGGRTLRGMGIPTGITLIVGGGYHGKSTLLRALECGVYPHIPGDGREYVVALPDLVKIRAEDGRSVTGVDIHAFIGALPGSGKNFKAGGGGQGRERTFSSQDASGSTSQAANIAEAIESGARGLLLDEDTSATNFMLRDARMQRLVERDFEPITPFVDRVREIYEIFGISTVLVMGGSGDYFDVADCVIMLRDYRAEDVTARAREIALEQETGRDAEEKTPLEAISPRRPLADSFVASRGRRAVSISTRSRELIRYGEEDLDLRSLSQLLDTSQTRAIGRAIHFASENLMGGRNRGLRDGRPRLSEILDALEAILDEEGLDALAEPTHREGRGGHPGNLARPRRHEIAAAINRLRSLKIDTSSLGPLD